MKVDILYFRGCPNHEPTRRRVENVVADIGAAAQIRDIEVVDQADAQSKRFLGSPSVRVDGIDIEPSAAALDRFGMMCRVYRTGAVASGVPPKHLIEEALKRGPSRPANRLT